MEKICFKCGKVKPYEDYYLHPAMADGHLSKCKECTRKDVKNRATERGKPIRNEYLREYRKRRKSPEWKKKSFAGTKKYAEIFYRTWQGSKTEYRALHLWVQKTLGTPERCESCMRNNLKGRQIHWANKTGAYLNESEDWIRLCARCHRKKDITSSRKLI